MTTNPTPCGWAGQTCDRPAIVQTWQTDARYGDAVTLERPLCGFQLDMELDAIQQLSNPLGALHVAPLNTEVTR